MSNIQHAPPAPTAAFTDEELWALHLHHSPQAGGWSDAGKVFWKGCPRPYKDCRSDEKTTEIITDRNQFAAAAINFLKEERHTTYLRTSLHDAVLQGNMDNVQRLLDSGIGNVHARYRDGCTALHDACNIGRVDIVRALIAAGSDPNIKLFAGLATPLHYACQKAHVDVVKYLVEAGGCDVEATDLDGFNGLHMLVRSCKRKKINKENVKQCIRFLISRPEGTRLQKATTTSCGGWSPLYLACHDKVPEIALMLLQEGVRVNPHNKPSPWNPPLIEVAKANECHEVVYFIEHGTLPPPSSTSSTPKSTTTQSKTKRTWEDAPDGSPTDEHKEFVLRYKTFLDTVPRNYVSAVWNAIKAVETFSKNPQLISDFSEMGRVVLTVSDFVEHEAATWKTPDAWGAKAFLTAAQRTALFLHAKQLLFAKLLTENNEAPDEFVRRRTELIRTAKLMAITARTTEELWWAAGAIFMVDAPNELSGVKSRVIEWLVNDLDTTFLVQHRRSSPRPLLPHTAKITDPNDNDAAAPPSMTSTTLESLSAEDMVWLALSSSWPSHEIPYETTFPNSNVTRDPSTTELLLKIFQLEPIHRYLHTNYMPPMGFVMAMTSHVRPKPPAKEGKTLLTTPWGTPTNQFHIAEFFPWIATQKKKHNRGWGKRLLRRVDACVKHQTKVEAQLLRWTLTCIQSSTTTHSTDTSGDEVVQYAAPPQTICDDVAKIIVGYVYGPVKGKDFFKRFNYYPE